MAGGRRTTARYTGRHGARERRTTLDAEFEAFLNSEVGKMYKNDTQKLMLYRVDADERESYGYKNVGQTERLGALLSMLCKEIVDMVAEWKENDG